MINILLINRLFAQNTLDKNRFIISQNDKIKRDSLLIIFYNVL